MIDRTRIPNELLILLDKNLGDNISDDFNFPPPVFDTMQGEIIDYNVAEKTLTNRFPILEEHHNPYGNMQGGIIAAAIDNTIGPLSLFVSPPNMTRQMDIKYSKIISPDLSYIYVTATFIKQYKRQLFFEAIVNNNQAEKLASAQSRHWIID
ncbi:MAG: PaaI family thioesterase [Gammaproteobacteria bacterium]|nr:PaaI family thioesterase [Gammaproteobacteria bacterium]